MPTSALAITSPSPKPQGCSQTEQLAREWAVTFAELYSVSLRDRGPRFVALWVSALADLAPEVLDTACRKAMKSCRFFPTPAEIRGSVQTANDTVQDLETEQAWHTALDYVERWFHPDLGISRRAPRLPLKIEHAIRGAGGWHWLWGCPEDQLPWAKKSFIAAYVNITDLEKHQELMPHGAEARELLRRLSASATPISRTLARPTAAGHGELNADVSVLRDLHEKLERPQPVQVLPLEEFDRRKKSAKVALGTALADDAVLRAQVDEHLASCATCREEATCERYVELFTLRAKELNEAARLAKRQKEGSVAATNADLLAAVSA
jgi:hypothetical protein